MKTCAGYIGQYKSPHYTCGRIFCESSSTVASSLRSIGLTCLLHAFIYL